jgi:transcriptional regulator with XRE-family HTH domain
MPDKPQTIGAALNALRIRAGLSMAQLATEAGYSGQSSVQRYLESDYNRPLRPDIEGRFRSVLFKRGTPPIQHADLDSAFRSAPFLREQIERAKAQLDRGDFEEVDPMTADDNPPPPRQPLTDQQAAELAHVSPLATRITWARTKSGVSAADIAKSVGAPDESIVERWENGSIVPSDGQLVQIAARTSTLLYWLKHGKVFDDAAYNSPLLHRQPLSARLALFAASYDRCFGRGGEYPLLCEAVGAAQKLEQLSQVTG